MPRRKPASAKQRKAELQFKRAVQRGDVEAPPKQHPSSRRKRPGERSALPSSGSGVTTKKLESRFLKLDKDWLEHARLVASTTALPRPIPIEATILDLKAIAAVEDGPMPVLTAPRRPKWRYDQSKKEVEKNEEGIFTKWIKETDTAIKNWQKPAIVPEKETGKTDDAAERQWERSPTYFERNIEVWRQLWRVTEISQILLVLLDSRAPTIHYPGSLQSYLQALRPAPQIIFVLTKIDLVGASRARAWTEYLLSQNPGSQVILAESYEERNVLNDGRGAKKFLDPHIPPELLSRLIEALQTAHERLLTPPPEIASDEKRLKNWKPKIKESVNWKAACETYNIPASGEPSGSIGEDVEGDIDAPYVTVGLIGQPNVGKSSLLNALFGARKVRASKTPGKTKHFQLCFGRRKSAA